MFASTTRISKAIFRTTVISVIIIMIFRKTFTFNFAIIYCRWTFAHFTTTTLVKRVETIVLLSFTTQDDRVFTLVSIYHHCIIYSTVAKSWMIVLCHVTVLGH